MEEKKCKGINGCRMKAICKEKGITLKSISAATGMTEAHISLIKSGKVNPSISAVKRIAEALGSSLDYLCDMPVSGDGDEMAKIYAGMSDVGKARLLKIARVMAE